VRWAAVDFLMEANRQNRRRVRIEELILLALRCLAMLLIGLMLARVFVQPEALASMLGSKARTERIVVLDDSFSMGLRTGGQVRNVKDEGRAGANGAAASGREATVFGQAKTSIERLARWLREESADDSLTVLLTSRPDRAFRVEPAVSKMDLNAFAAELDALAPSSRGGNMPAAMEAVRQLLDSRKGNVNAAVYIVSDFQQVDWASPNSGGESGGNGLETSAHPGLEEVSLHDSAAKGAAHAGEGRLRSPVSALNGWAGRGRSLRIVLVDTGVEATENLCVSAIEPQQAQAVAGVGARYLARITNFGKADSRAGSMRVFVGDAVQPPVAVPAVPAGESVEVPVEITFPAEGPESITVELDPDPLPIDNSRTLSVPVARALRVLLVNGEPSADPYQDEVFLLSVAIRPEGPQFSGNEVTVVDESNLESADLSAYHVIMLANVYRLTEEVAARLESFAAAGGGVAVFMGDQVDPEIYNRILYRDGKGLMPAQLGEVISAPNDRPGFGFGDVDGSQPLMRRFADPQAGLLRGVTTWRFIAAEPAAVGATTAPAGSAPKAAGSANSQLGVPARVLLRFDDPDKHPALIERPFGNGRVVLLTTSIDKEWTSLPDRPLFVLLAMEMVQHLARPPARSGEQLVGEPIRLKLDPARYRPSATLKTPRYPEEPAVRIEAQPDPDTALPTIYWPETGEPGLYRFELTETNGGETVEQAAVDVDPRESDLRRTGRAALLGSMSGLPVKYVAGEDLLQEHDDQARRELWPSVLIALVAVLMIEQSLAAWFGSDRNWRALLGGRKP
jgi:hypothetical protein